MDFLCLTKTHEILVKHTVKLNIRGDIMMNSFPDFKIYSLLQ